VAANTYPERMTVAVDLPLDRIAQICRDFGVTELAVFGSAVRGDFGPDSDIDFLYVLSEDSTLGWEIVDLRDALQEATGRAVDIVPKDYLHWVVRDRVLAEAETVYAVAA
jgi:predicted nucleotidyltransferase